MTLSGFKFALSISRLIRYPRPSAFFLLPACLLMVFRVCGYGQTSAPLSFSSALIPVTNGAYGPFTVDSSGNVYFVSSDGQTILKETRVETTYLQSTITVMPGVLQVPHSMAVDGSGDLFFVAGCFGSPCTVYKEAPTSNGYVQTSVYNSTDDLLSITADFKNNLYILDSTQNEAIELSPSSSGYTQRNVAVQLTNPIDIGVDSTGNVYILEITPATGAAIVLRFTDDGSVYVGTEYISDVDATTSSSMAVDASGDVYITDDESYQESYSSVTLEIQPVTFQRTPIPSLGSFLVAGLEGSLYESGGYGPGTSIYRHTFSSPNFGTVEIKNSATAILVFQVASGFANSALTGTIEGLDFNLLPNPLTYDDWCLPSSNFFQQDMFCYLEVSFAPTGLAFYTANLVLKGSNSQSLPVSVQLQGFGAAPEIAFGQDPQSIILSAAAPYNLQGPEGVAVDAKGDLYIADTQGKQVLKETPSGGQYTQTVIANSQNGLQEPVGVAIDSAGNVYVADSQVGILKETPTSSGFTQSTAISGVYPLGVAVDSNGALYFPTGNLVVKAVPNGGQYTQTTLLNAFDSNSISLAQGIAVDPGGDVYVADSGYQRVIKLSPANGGYAQSTVASGFYSPWAVAVDLEGNVYVGDQGGGVYKENLSNGSYTQSIITGVDTDPYGVAVDGSGNVYVTELQPARVYEFPVAQAASLSFSNTPVGTTSSDSPQTLTVENVGFYPLTFAAGGNNPTLSSDFTISDASTCPVLSPTSPPFQLAPGSVCTYLINFSPTTVGTISGHLVLSDDSGSVNTSQLIPLSGIATAAVPVVNLSASSLNFSSQATGTTSSAQAVTVSNNGSASLNISLVSVSGDFAQTNNCTTIAAGANCTISVTFTPTAAGSRIGTLTIADNASGSPQTVALSGTGIVAAPAIALSASNLTFNSQAVGSTSAAQTVTLTNAGTAALAINSIAASGDFGQTNNCGSSVAAGANCTISVTFTPTAAGARTGTLTITDNASGSPQTVQLAGTGSSVSITPPSGSSGLSISSAGGSATATLQIGSAGGFSGTVNLTCAVAYTGTGTANDPPTCSLNPTQETVTASSTANVTLTVNTTAATSSMLRPIGGGTALAALAVLIFTPRRRWRGLLMLLALGLVAAISFTACGGGGSANGSGGSGGGNPPPNPGTTTGSYNVTVTATSGSDTATATIPLSVQ